MKKILFILLMIFLMFSCNCKTCKKNQNAESDKAIQKQASKLDNVDDCCIPDSNQFYYKRLKQTANIDDLGLINKMHGINCEQAKEWLQPLFHDSIFPSKSDLYIKMISFQKVTSEYTSIIIAVTFDMPNQYFITINNKGKFIDCLPISYVKDLSNSNVEYYKERAVYKFSTKVLSYFEGDTIRVFSIEDVSKLEEPHESKDTWKELYETKYIVNQDGLIQLLTMKKQVDSSKIDDLQ